MSTKDQAQLKAEAKEMIKEFNIQARDEPVINPSKPTVEPITRGEIEFEGLGTGGHRAHYMIAPKAMEEPDEILRWMFSRKQGWRLKAPKLMLSCYGGRDHYINWPNSATLKNKDAWTQALTQSSTTGSDAASVEKGLGPGPGVLQDFEFRRKFKGRLEEISGGVCKAVTECGGWFDLGAGGRGGFNEILMDGLKVYWSAFGSLAGHKQDSVVLAIRMLEDTEFEDAFVKHAVPVSTSAKDKTKDGSKDDARRVIYPSTNAKLFPELSGNFQEDNEQDLEGFEEAASPTPPTSAAKTPVSGLKAPSGKASMSSSVTRLEAEVRHSLTSRFLCNACTHIIFLQNKQVRDKLKLKLKTLATRAVICANGNPQLIMPGVDGKIIMEAIAGTPVVCLHNTGGAAEMLGAAILRRRQPDLKTEEYNYNLPENVPDDQVLVLNPAKDSVEKVIDKLTLVLSTVQDDEMQEVGYAKGEKTRLLYAWEIFVLYRYNARYFRRRARLFQYVSMFLAVFVTLISLLANGAKDGSLHEMLFFFYLSNVTAPAEDDDGRSKVTTWLSENQHVLRIGLILVPVFSTFVLTMSSRLNPLGKWANLESGAVAVRSEIMKYRCRVMDYQPRKGSSADIEERVEDLCSTPAYALEDPDMETAKRKQRKKKENADAKNVSRRVAFSTELERINVDAIGSDIRTDYLEAPPQSAMEELKDEFYNSRKVWQEYEAQRFSINGFLWRNACCGCYRRAFIKSEAYRKLNTVSRPETENLLEEDFWDQVGGDFMHNPHAVDSEYLRDDGLGLITAEDYIHFRFLPMLQYYSYRSKQLTIIVQSLNVLIFFCTATVAAAGSLEMDSWVPFLVSIISFLSAVLEFENLPAQQRNVNQSLESLKNLRVWWQSLSMVERRLPGNKEILVDASEATADAEISAWKKSLKTKPKNLSGVVEAGEDRDEDE